MKSRPYGCKPDALPSELPIRGVHDRTRTYTRLLRRQLLSPVKLHEHENLGAGVGLPRLPPAYEASILTVELTRQNSELPAQGILESFNCQPVLRSFSFRGIIRKTSQRCAPSWPVPFPREGSGNSRPHYPRHR